LLYSVQALFQEIPDIVVDDDDGEIHDSLLATLALVVNR